MIHISKGEKRQRKGTLGAPRPQTCAKGLRPLDSNRRLGWEKTQTKCACDMVESKQASGQKKSRKPARK